MQRLKKISCICLSLCLTFITLFTATQKVNAETIKIGVIAEPGENKIGVVLRKDASKTSDKLITLWDGDTLTIITTKKDISGANYTWYQGTISKNGVTYTGYIRQDMINISEYVIDPTFEQQLADFPESYHADLIKLHAIYPNWVFRADKLNVTFAEAVALEDVGDYKLIDGSYLSLRSMRRGCYDWNDGTWIVHDARWYGASRELISYYMDPRNFLNANDIFVYMKQGYDSNTQTKQGVYELVKGTFLDATVTDTNDEYYGKTFTDVIMAAAVQSSVSPYIIASTILQEQSSNGATLSNGTTYNGVTVYNFMNWKATGNTEAQKIQNGAAYAYSNGWTTPSKSIIGGANLYGSGYVSKGQDTYFYKNYNIIGSTNVNHQYAQNVADSYSSAKKLAKMYVENNDINLTFRIPVYKNNSLPSTVSPYPAKNSKKNNYYFDNISVSGLTPSFYRYTYEYSLSVSGNTTVNIDLPDGASLASGKSYSLKKGDNTVTLTVKAETGFTNNYIINVSASNACTLNISTGGGSSSTVTVKKGDTNGDGKISLSDLANVRLHLLGSTNLSGNAFTGADTNGDGKISLSDLANIRLHLLGKVTLN